MKTRASIPFDLWPKKDQVLRDAQTTVETMIRAAQLGPEIGTSAVQLPFDIHTVENL
jgi:hypothetical protein